jgi:hypothetical protein
MRFRAGVVYREGNRYNAPKIKIVQRNCSRSNGIVKYRRLGLPEILRANAQDLKHYKPLTGF